MGEKDDLQTENKIILALHLLILTMFFISLYAFELLSAVLSFLPEGLPATFHVGLVY